MQPHLRETAARCAELDPTLTVVEDAFTADPAIGIFSAAIAMPDGRVFLVPGDELAEAVTAADGRIEVRPVATLEDALDVLADLGGDPVPAPDAAAAPTGG